MGLIRYDGTGSRHYPKSTNVGEMKPGDTFMMGDQRMILADDGLQYPYADSVDFSDFPDDIEEGLPAYVPPQNGGNNGRSTPSPDGGSGSGTNTGFKGIDLGSANKFYTSRGLPEMANYNSFLSNTLPVDENQTSIKIGGKTYELEGEDLVDFREAQTEAPGMQEGMVYEGISTPGKNGSSPADTADNNRSIRIDPRNSGDDDDDERFSNFGADYGETYTSTIDPMRAKRRAAFLSDQYTGSIKAVMAANAASGHYTSPDGKKHMRFGDELKEVSPEYYRASQGGIVDPKDFKDAFIKSKVEPVISASSQSDLTTPQGAQSFETGNLEQMGTRYQGGDVFDENNAVDFTMNNTYPGDDVLGTSPYRNMNFNNGGSTPAPSSSAPSFQTVNEDKYGSVDSLIKKYGEKGYLERLDAGKFF